MSCLVDDPVSCQCTSHHCPTKSVRCVQDLQPMPTERTGKIIEIGGQPEESLRSRGQGAERQAAEWQAKQAGLAERHGI